MKRRWEEPFQSALVRVLRGGAAARTQSHSPQQVAPQALTEGSAAGVLTYFCRELQRSPGCALRVAACGCVWLHALCLAGPGHVRVGAGIPRLSGRPALGAPGLGFRLQPPRPGHGKVTRTPSPPSAEPVSSGRLTRQRRLCVPPGSCGRPLCAHLLRLPGGRAGLDSARQGCRAALGPRSSPGLWSPQNRPCCPPGSAFSPLGDPRGPSRPGPSV